MVYSKEVVILGGVNINTIESIYKEIDGLKTGENIINFYENHKNQFDYNILLKQMIDNLKVIVKPEDIEIKKKELKEKVNELKRIERLDNKAKELYDKGIHSGLKPEIKILQSNKFIRYSYGDEKSIVSKSRLIGDIHLRVNTKNALKIGKKYLENLKNKWNKSPLYCLSLNNKRVVLNSRSINHLGYSSQGKRGNSKIKRRVELLPYIEDIIKNGRLYEITEQYSKQDLFDYGLIGIALINGKNIIIKVVLSEIDKRNKLLYLSIFDI